MITCRLSHLASAISNRTARICIFVLYLQPFITIAPADTLVVPGEAASRFGDTYSDPLFLVRPKFFQVYGAQEFVSAGAGPLLISEMAFRLDPADAGSLNVILPSLSIRATTYAGAISTVSMATMTSLNYTTVLETSNLPLRAKPTVPSNFAIVLRFGTPYIYYPENGELVLEFNAGLAGGFIQSIDAQHSTDGVVLRTDGGLHPVIDPIIAVTQFTYSTIPEPVPSAIAFLGSGIFALASLTYGKDFKCR